MLTIYVWHPAIGQLEERLRVWPDHCFYWTLAQ
jgi:hypothetical protein